MKHPALQPGAVAVITGGAAGIGFAAATRFAEMGLRVVIADQDEHRLLGAAEALATVAPGGAAGVIGMAVDVRRLDHLQRLEATVRERFGGTDVLMNNAGIQPGSAMFGPADNWQRILGVNLWGVIHGTQVFVPGMIERGRPGLVINGPSWLEQQTHSTSPIRDAAPPTVRMDAEPSIPHSGRKQHRRHLVRSKLTASSVIRARSAAISRVDITDGVTMARTPTASTSAARWASTESITNAAAIGT